MGARPSVLNHLNDRRYTRDELANVVINPLSGYSPLGGNVPDSMRSTAHKFSPGFVPTPTEEYLMHLAKQELLSGPTVAPLQPTEQKAPYRTAESVRAGFKLK